MSVPGFIFLDLLTRNPALYLTIVLAVIVSITLHELGHCVVALWQGDDTAKAQGHLTLNPVVHMPPFSLLLLFLAGISYGLTPVNPSRFRSRHGDALVAVAGPFVNLLLALVSLTIYGIWIRITHESAHAGTAKHVQLFLLEMGSLNIVLLLFNLLPVPPLDGSSVLGSFSPDFHRAATNPANRGVFMGVFLLVFFFSGSIFTLADGVVASFLQLFGLTVG